MIEEDNQKKIINRLRRTEGQLRGVQKMIDDQKECIDIITQLSAVRSSIDRTMGIIVAENLQNCLENPSNNVDEQSKKLQEAIQMIIKK
ncbi:metal-sensitive transcriptional regulator [Ligilactobacillus sp. WILCCON 0076]|uniref:Metal-sensitive transcriptional regulator n=1 Tax=Ligilactobacillus ubinensis TaxID=2876789 RepID=A0A9X2FK24_9LACO|nr:metal-sensitive transcriptional regulator [Ligilactobacillus ubinensis]MCP0887122.1 metal-sensitive transcriptional regulator [Ligilactobacillus ubinensis]